MAKVDVIIPAYNGARFLATAIESVMAQTFEDWRIVLVDDGSVDGTAEIAEGFAQRLGEKMRFIRQPNKGVSAARNRAIRESTAELLALLDSDDVWLPWRLEESVKAFEGRPEVGIVYGYNSRITPEGELIDTFDQRQEHGEGWIAPYLYMRTVDMSAPTITVRKSCVDEVGGFDETLRVTEDRDLWVRIATRHQVALVPRVIAYYRTSPDSATTDPDRMLRSQMQFIEKHYGAPGCGFVARRVALSRIHKQRAEALAIRGRNGAAVRSALTALALYPVDMGNVRTAGSLMMRWAGLVRG